MVFHRADDSDPPPFCARQISTERGSKPESQKIPSPQLKPSHECIQVDELPVATERVSRNDLRLKRAMSELTVARLYTPAIHPSKSMC